MAVGPLIGWPQRILKPHILLILLVKADTKLYINPDLALDKEIAYSKWHSFGMCKRELNYYCIWL